MPRSKIEASYRAIGSLIARRRRELGLSQSQVGQKLGVSHQIVHRYEKGQARIQVARLIELSDLLKLDFVSFKEAVKAGGTSELTPEDMAARRLGKLGRELAHHPEKLDAVVNLGRILLAEASDAQPPPSRDQSHSPQEIVSA